jgi:hypothetical protein
MAGYLRPSDNQNNETVVEPLNDWIKEIRAMDFNIFYLRVIPNAKKISNQCLPDVR